jgi:hypothetical protein
MFSKFLFIFFNQETFIEKLILEHEFHYEFLSYYSLEHFFSYFFNTFTILAMMGISIKIT